MSEAKVKLKLSIGERIAAIKIFDAFKGNLSTLAVLLDDVKQFPVTEEEWKEAKLVKVPNADGTENWSWNEEGTAPKEIELQVESLSYLKDEIKKKSDSGEVSLKDIALLSLNKKLA